MTVAVDHSISQGEARALLAERTLRLQASIEFSGKSAEDVFSIMGDPERITDWYLLAKSVRMSHSDDSLEMTTSQDKSFTVDFVLFGELAEEILFWDPPHSYIYRAVGPEFPIQDYYAEIAVSSNGESRGTLHWRIYFDVVDSLKSKDLIPVILPPVTEASIQRLSTLVGGVSSGIRSNFVAPLSIEKDSTTV